jgi:hypothetical protein
MSSGGQQQAMQMWKPLRASHIRTASAATRISHAPWNDFALDDISFSAGPVPAAGNAAAPHNAPASGPMSIQAQMTKMSDD